MPKINTGQSPLYNFMINSSDTFSHISIDHLEINFSKILDAKTVYATMVVEKFQIYGVQITGKCIWKSEYWI